MVCIPPKNGAVQNFHPSPAENGGHHGTAEAPVDFLCRSIWTARAAGDGNSRSSNGPCGSGPGLGIRLRELALPSTPSQRPREFMRIQSYVCNWKCHACDAATRSPPELPAFPLFAACSSRPSTFTLLLLFVLSQYSRYSGFMHPLYLPSPLSPSL